MKFKIVFSAAEKESRHEAAARFVISRKPKPTKSLVLIHFPARNMTLSYYNDQFDLHCGDLVFVDGKLEGFRGHVVDVCYTFKIKLSDYKRVISVADTKVHGEFHFAGSHFVTFDRSALPYEQVITWFKAPEKEDTEIVSEQDGSGFQLNDLQTMKISDAIAERGHDYYRENRVRYISLDKTRVSLQAYAIRSFSSAVTLTLMMCVFRFRGVSLRFFFACTFGLFISVIFDLL